MKTRRFFIGLVVVVLLLVVVGYAGASVVVYNQLSALTPACIQNNGQNTPSAYVIDDERVAEPASYLMPTFEAVRFPSRDAEIEISGWYIPAPDSAEDAPTVITVHGLNSCKFSSGLLYASGMLNRNGFNVLAIDYRDHGDSEIEDGRYAAGTEEYRDVLGAWDWLVNERGAAPERIGLYGQSLGAAVVTIAMGEEPAVAATWEDSGFADINTVLTAELTRFGFPTFLAPGGLLMGRVIAGDDLTTLNPLRAMGKIDGRPFYITHGTEDTRLSVQYAYDLANALTSDGGTIEPWIVEGSGHVQAMLDLPEDYEERLITFFRASLDR